MRSHFAITAGTCLLALVLRPNAQAVAQAPPPAGAASQATVVLEAEPAEKEEKTQDAWQSLMPKDGLGKWEVTDFGTQGKVEVKGKELLLEMGDPLTGVDLKDDVKFPRNNFEVELKCKRTEGNDFLCGLTFPVGEAYCSFIAGGWGGGLVGLSSINGMDASENATSSYYEFDNDMWYTFRVRVDDEYVRAWIDDKEMVRQDRDGYTFSTRIEVSGSKPLGLCVFRSTVAVTDFRWRVLDPDKEKEAENKAAEKRDDRQETDSVEDR